MVKNNQLTKLKKKADQVGIHATIVNFFKKNLLPLSLISFVTLLIVFSTLDCLARAGGAGGGNGGGGGGFSSSGSSSGSGDSELIFYLIIQIIRIILMLPFPLNLIVLALIALTAFIIYRKGNQISALNDIPVPGKTNNTAVERILLKDGTFSKLEFTKKVETAFYKIQRAWEKMEIDDIRIFLSDGVYRRFSTQFLMMNLIGQKNMIDKVEIRNIFIDAADQDGDFDILHVGIDAYIEERFSSAHDGLTQSFSEYFREYWSFIRKRGIQSRDIYHAQRCPNCDAELDFKMGELSRCNYCGTIFNSGEYDWVLAEITQAQDYSIETRLASKRNQFDDKIRKVTAAYPDFSIQHLEDIASNAYLQILSAETLHSEQMAKRFMSDAFFASWMKDFEKNHKSGITLAYNRLYLNAVTLVSFHENNDSYIAGIALRRSYQRLAISSDAIKKIDAGLVSDNRMIFLQRNKSGNSSKGSLYAHMCPVCAAPLSDSKDITCTYCNSSLNNPANEWIVCGLIEGNDASEFISSFDGASGTTMKKDLYDSVYDVRDYAFNNILALIACDGVISPKEREFALSAAKRFGYSSAKVLPMIELAISGKLAIRMPENLNKRNKIIRLMEKAAKADDDYSQIEQEFIAAIRQQFLQ